jgi:hypothetical protein
MYFKFLSITFSIVTFLSLQVISQKIDLDRFYFEYSFRALPQKPLPIDARTYQVQVISNLNESLNLNKSEMFSISGLKRATTNAGVMIQFRFDDIMIAKTTPIERVVINKDKDGKEIGRNFFYKMEILYTLNSFLQITSRTGNSLFSQVENPRRTYITPEYATVIDAQNFWLNNMNSLRNKMTEDVLNDFMLRTNKMVNAQIGYAENTISKNLWITDSPKHSENENFISNTKSLASKIKRIGCYDDVKLLVEDLVNEEKYFKSIPQKYTSTEKADVKLRYGAFYNLALLYLCTDRPELAIAEADKLIANDYDKFDGKIIKSDAENILALMNTNKLFTTHFQDKEIQP